MGLLPGLISRHTLLGNMALEFLVPPWEHQKAAIDRARELDYFALFFEQGTGKTSCLINILRDKFQNERHPTKTLILCPPIVIENWRREFLKYSHVPDSQITLLTGSASERRLRLKSKGYGIFITNYHSLLMPHLFDLLLEAEFDIVVLDESHKIKSYNSKTSKKALRLGKKARCRYILSGTPILNTASDIFPQIGFLDQGKTFGEKFFEFRSRYFVDFNAAMPRERYFPNWKIKPSSLKEINEAIKPISSRVLKEDCLDLPPLIRQRIDCELLAPQESIYKRLEKEFVAELSQNSQVITDLEIVKGLRLQQIVSGYVPDETGVIFEFTPNSRIEALRDLLTGLAPTHKIIVWAVFRENFKAIQNLAAELKIPYVSVFGGVPAEEQARRCEAFETDPSIKLLIGHPKSCGVGVNLTAADYSIWFSRNFSLEDDLQAEARNYRGGSERHKSIVRIDLVTPHTIDEVILNALASKQALSDAILQHYKKDDK